MPTYTYRCEKCREEFDKFQGINDPKLTKCCLTCCNGDVKRLVGKGSGIKFKGSGFYETDYRSKSVRY